MFCQFSRWLIELIIFLLYWRLKFLLFRQRAIKLTLVRLYSSFLQWNTVSALFEFNIEFRFILLCLLFFDFRRKGGLKLGELNLTSANSLLELKLILYDEFSVAFNVTDCVHIRLVLVMAQFALTFFNLLWDTGEVVKIAFVLLQTLELRKNFRL